MEEEKEAIVEEEEAYDLFKSWTPEMLAYKFTKRGLAQIGRVVSTETRLKISSSERGKVIDAHTREAVSRATMGRPCSASTRQKLSEANTGRVRSEETLKRMSLANLGRTISEEHKKKISEGNRGQVRSPEFCERMSEIRLGKPHGPFSAEARANMSKAHLGLVYSKAHREAISEGLSGYLKNLSTEERRGRNLKANSCEESILEVLEAQWKGDWKFTGDFSFWIGTKNPDFTNINGKKAVIEHFGQYYHSQWYFPNTMSEEATIEYYKAWGFRCIILKEEYLCSDYVVGEVSKLYYE